MRISFSVNFCHRSRNAIAHGPGAPPAASPEFPWADMARTASLAGLQIYFDCGSEDDFGFDAGAVALDKTLGSRHISHEFHLYPGGHNWVYVADHLPALLQFHFRVFESAWRRRNSPQ